MLKIVLIRSCTKYLNHVTANSKHAVNIIKDVTFTIFIGLALIRNIFNRRVNSSYSSKISYHFPLHKVKFNIISRLNFTMHFWLFF